MNIVKNIFHKVLYGFGFGFGMGVSMRFSSYLFNGGYNEQRRALYYTSTSPPSVTEQNV